MTDIGTQLRDYFGEIVEHVDPDDVLVPSPSVRVAFMPGAHRRVPGWVVAASMVVAALILAGLAAVLLGSDGEDPPVITQPDSTFVSTTLAPTPTTTLIPSPAPESLNRSQMEHQVEFLSSFERFGFLTGGGCSGPERGPSFECTVDINSPTLGGPTTLTFTVAGETGQEADEPVAPDDMHQGGLYGAAVREVAENGLAALYAWALEVHPDETAGSCLVGFTGNDTDLAWSPGYAANSTCGEHLAGLLLEFAPSEAPQQLEPPDPTAGLWSQVEPVTPDGPPTGWVFFDVADTPAGLLATGLDGLWISQDGIEWRPYARDSIEWEDGGFSKIATSDLGIGVTDAGSGTWFSPDGAEWTLTELPQGRPSVGGNALTADDDRFLIINSERQVLSSTDGTEWEVVEQLAATDFFLVESTPFGFFAGTTDGDLWTSPDGVAWSRVFDGVFNGGVVNDIAGSPAGLVAVTWDGRMWHSPDAADWTVVYTLPPGPFNGFSERLCTRVAASDTGYLVVTVHEDPSGLVDSGVPAAWFSEDGRLWARVTTEGGDTPDPGSICQNEVIPFNGGFLSVTDDQGGSDHNDMVWIYEP